ncbi:hypothetical protein SS50377_27259 [Spironucleus salmonicida]|uniref:RRM domain-containing protein n=1 Tax=Spironucleus salmonicida TaxID=348837 RepID=V6LKQ3_9EUKA|nr:hypothetical protein SS50377_27259 [Spironucleus salmonicida]|eukprot:EST44311.1 Hypothetical protein SS50377_15847 [Spironucleus salmonicida]
MGKIIVSSETELKESDMREFFDFCGDILEFTILTSQSPYEVIIEFAGSINNPLLLDGTIFNGFALNIKRYGEKTIQKDTALEELSQITRTKNLIGKGVGWFIGSAKKLMQPCLGGTK